MNNSAVSNTDRFEDETRSALTHLPAHLRFWIVAGFALGLDLWSKEWVFHTLKPNEIRPMVDGIINFHRSLNDGAVFGSFRGSTSMFIVASVLALGFVFYLFSHSTWRQRGLHVALALILSGALGNLYDRALVKADVINYQDRSGRERTMIGSIVSDADDPVLRVQAWPDGGSPREFSRSEVTLRRQGVVRDFIKFVPEFPKWVPKLGGRDVWPWIFNVADSALVCGVILLLLSTWVERPQHHRSGQSS